MRATLRSMANTLAPGETRIGFIFDGLPETPHVAVQLARTKTHLEMKLPWHPSYNSMHKRWFSGDTTHWGDDPERTRFRYRVPSEIDFVDPFGPVALVGVTAAGRTANFGASGIGVGTARVDYAVFGARDASRFKEVNGIRSEIEGLGTWMGLDRLSFHVDRDADESLVTLNLALSTPGPVPIARPLNLSIVPAYAGGAGEHPDETVVKERMLVETYRKRSDTWTSHLAMHLAIRDLLRVSSWHRLNFLRHEATRDDDPVRTLDATARGRAWHMVDTALTDLADAPAKLSHVGFLFTHRDLGAGGVHRWLAYHREHTRVVQPFIRLLELEGATVETHLAQLGMGMDALAYKLARDSGLSRTKAKEEILKDKVLRIVESAGPLPFTAEDVAERLSVAYNAVKHADRAMPGVEDLVTAYLMGIQVFRAWVATLLGAKGTAITTKISSDRITRRLPKATLR